MTPEERFQRIEEKHLALAESVQLLTADIRAAEAKEERLDARERQARQALLTGIAAYLRALNRNGTEDPEPAQ